MQVCSFLHLFIRQSRPLYQHGQTYRQLFLPSSSTSVRVVPLNAARNVSSQETLKQGENANIWLTGYI